LGKEDPNVEGQEGAVHAGIQDRGGSTAKGYGGEASTPTESLWGSLKVARLHFVRFATRRAAMDEVIDWMGFYNHRRLHSTLAYVSPMQFEQRWLADQEKRAA
jgi:transposase InsO family protein